MSRQERTKSKEKKFERESGREREREDVCYPHSLSVYSLPPFLPPSSLSLSRVDTP